MRVIQVSAKADPDGVIRLSIPAGSAGAEYKLAVVLTPKPTASGPASPKTPEELGWPPGFLESTYGSITDETFVRGRSA
ncbi:MAG: hypothetical protein JWO38_8181 [Gemmataceae bacterium]|nr:hypothetical protein [Gemmataceae bacterium]